MVITNNILVSGAAMLSTLNIIQAVLILGTLRKLSGFFISICLLLGYWSMWCMFQIRLSLIKVIKHQTFL